MNIFSKYILKSACEKKLRTTLLLFTIAISVSLLVTAMGSAKSILNVYDSQMRENYGDYNVKVTAAKGSAIPLFDPSEVKGDGIDKTFKALAIGGYVADKDDKTVTLLGTNFKDFESFKSIKVIKKDNLEPFEGNKAIISQKTSDSLGVGIGENLKLSILGKENIYKISAIVSNNGLFFNDSVSNFTVITSEENLSSIYRQQNRYSYMLMDINKENLNSWITDFNDNNKDKNIVASQILNEDAVKQQLNVLRGSLLAMISIVLIISIFIIFSSFKLIIFERIPIIGTFLSQGSTKGKILRVFVKESLLYGILGGILGDLISLGFLNLITVYCNPLKEFGVKATTTYYPSFFIVGIGFALVLSLVSSIMPILQIRKLPVKDVILNTISTSSKISLKSSIIGLILIAISLFIHFSGRYNNYILSIPSLFLFIVGVMLIIPYFVEKFILPFILLVKNVNGLSMISLNNVRTSKVLINNIRLIIVAIISFIMVTSFKFGIINVLDGAYSGMNFDVVLYENSDMPNRKAVQDIVNNYSNINKTGEIDTYLDGNKNRSIALVYEDIDAYKNFENYITYDDKDNQLEELKNNDDGIIISKQLSVRYKIKKGDIITLNYNDKNIKMRVLSIMNPKLRNGGNYNLISLNTAERYFDVEYPQMYYISTNMQQDKAKIDLEKKVKGLGYEVETRNEMQKKNEDSNKQLTNMLGMLSYVTIFIGAFGIIGNMFISIIQRKKDIALLSSVGLTNGGRRYMIFLEGIFQTIIGLILSLVSAFGVNVLFQDIFKFMTLDIDIVFPTNSIGVIALSTTILMILISLLTISRNKKINIINELKYE